MCGIGNDNKEELLYLFGILSSPITSGILEANLKNENEKDYLVSIASVKEFVRVPKIAKERQSVKKEIIDRTQELLAIEETKLADLVDFSRVMIQKFDSVKVKGNELVLRKGTNEKKLKIKSSKDVVEKTITERYASEELEFENEKAILSELKSLPAIDFEKQAVLKDYIDDLVFALYFNVPLEKLGLEYADEIKRECEKSKYYRIVKKFGGDV